MKCTCTGSEYRYCRPPDGRVLVQCECGVLTSWTGQRETQSAVPYPRSGSAVSPVRCECKTEKHVHVQQKLKSGSGTQTRKPKKERNRRKKKKNSKILHQSRALVFPLVNPVWTEMLIKTRSALCGGPAVRGPGPDLSRHPCVRLKMFSQFHARICPGI